MGKPSLIAHVPSFCRSSYQENVSLTDATLDEAIEQNWGLLNRASRFVRCVVSEAEARTIDRRWVSAFDEVHDTASLADHLANLTKKTPREVLLFLHLWLESSKNDGKMRMNGNIIIGHATILKRPLHGG